MIDFRSCVQIFRILAFLRYLMCFWKRFMSQKYESRADVGGQGQWNSGQLCLVLVRNPDGGQTPDRKSRQSLDRRLTRFSRKSGQRRDKDRTVLSADVWFCLTLNPIYSIWKFIGWIGNYHHEFELFETRLWSNSRYWTYNMVSIPNKIRTRGGDWRKFNSNLLWTIFMLGRHHQKAWLFKIRRWNKDFWQIIYVLAAC